MGSLTDDKPPVPRYRFTLTVTGNTLDEIESELVSQTRGGFLLAPLLAAARPGRGAVMGDLRIAVLDTATGTVVAEPVWLLIAPCGCLGGIEVVDFDRNTGPRFWDDDEPGTREKDESAGWTVRLADSADKDQWHLGCDHDPQWGQS